MTSISADAPRWTRLVLWAAAAFHWGWSILFIGWPALPFRLAGLPPSNYPELVQGLGLLIGVFGLGFFVAGFNAFHHWLVVALGFAAKAAGGTAMLWAVWQGRLPVYASWLALASDLLWCVPFGIILSETWNRELLYRRMASPDVLRFALRARSNAGVTLEELSALSPTMVVFLRHTGCMFCREALSDLARQRKAIEETGTRLVLVHMATDGQAGDFFARFGLDDLPRISDPKRNLYRAFGLRRGSLAEIIGPHIWLRGFQAAVLERNWFGRFVGDTFQMPGVFLLYQGEVVRSFRHQTIGDRPNYLYLATGRSVMIA